MDSPWLTIGIFFFTIIFGVLGWFLVDFVSQTRNSVNDVDKTVKVISKDQKAIELKVTSIEANVTHLMKAADREAARKEAVIMEFKEQRGRFTK